MVRYTPTKAGRSPDRVLFGRFSTGVAWSILVASFLHPPHGLGIPLCLSRFAGGVACGGCGLSRSVSCTVRGMLAEGAAYHPMGPLVVLFSVSVAAISLLPGAQRARWRTFIDAHRAVFSTIPLALAIGFSCVALMRYLFSTTMAG